MYSSISVCVVVSVYVCVVVSVYVCVVVSVCVHVCVCGKYSTLKKYWSDKCIACVFPHPTHLTFLCTEMFISYSA